jgi:transcriptional regulator with XRE-family HTH domain
MGLTQRELGARLGLTVTAWQYYESGRNYPGGQVFERLCKLGVNVNWLFTGAGNMFQDAGKVSDPDAMAEDVLGLQQLRESTMRVLDIDKLLTPSAMSHFFHELAIRHTLLQLFPNGLTFEQIRRRLLAKHVTLDDLGIHRMLSLLCQRKVVEEVSGQPTIYRSIKAHQSLEVTDFAGHAASTLLAMHDLSRDIFPNLEPDPPHNKVMGVRVSTSPQRLAEGLREFRESARKWYRGLEDQEGRMEMVLVLGVGGNPIAESD